MKCRLTKCWGKAVPGTLFQHQYFYHSCKVQFVVKKNSQICSWRSSCDDIFILDEGRGWIARRVDLIVVPYSQYWYALVGWTGNKHFNRSIRLYAQKQLNCKLTSHALYNMTTVSVIWTIQLYYAVNGVCFNIRAYSWSGVYRLYFFVVVVVTDWEYVHCRPCDLGSP